jgi:alpha-amylase
MKYENNFKHNKFHIEYFNIFDIKIFDKLCKKKCIMINKISFFSLIVSIIVLISCTNSNNKNAEKNINKNKNRTSMKHPEWSKNLSIYEVNLRQYSHAGTFNKFAEHLPRLKEMGVGILWLMPIQPIGELNRKGSLGSYYSIKDYLNVNPEFGTMEEFKQLVQKIHDLGMFVIIDWVANHTAWDNNLTADHRDFFTLDSAGNFTLPVDDWSDVIDLNYENQEMRKYMIEALKFWVSECNIDGYRCDVAGMVPTDFWNNARQELDKIKPVFMLAEAEQLDLHEKAFDMSYAWNFMHIMNDIAQGKKETNEFINHFNKELKEYSKNDYRMYFTTNHDENSWNGTVFERLGDGAESFAALSFVVPGMPLIYSGQETGLNKRLAFFEKDTIDWTDFKYQKFYSKLNKLKNENKVLWNGEFGGDFVSVDNSFTKDVYSFIRKNSEQQILAIFNFSENHHEIQLFNDLVAGKYLDYFSNELVEIDKETKVSLSAWDYKILIKK